MVTISSRTARENSSVTAAINGQDSNFDAQVTADRPKRTGATWLRRVASGLAILGIAFGSAGEAGAASATGEIYNMTQGGTLTGNVGSNDTFADAVHWVTGFPAGFSAAASTGCSGWLLGNGSFTYTPPPSFHGTVTIGYDVHDSCAGPFSGTVYATINVQMVPPVAVDDNYSVAEDTPLTMSVKSNDAPNPNPTTIVNLTQPLPGRGSVAISGANIQYTPTTNYNGPANFTYQLSNGVASSNVATVNLTITSVNDKPVAQNINYTIPEQSTAMFPSGALFAGATDPEGNTIQNAQVVSGFPTLVVSPNGAFSFDASAPGVYQFTYRVSDGTDFSDPKTVTVTVTNVNDVPIASPDNVPDALEDTPYLINVLANDTDQDIVEGNPQTLTPIITQQPLHGTAVVQPSGEVLYTPYLNYFGPDSFSYLVFDGQSVSNIVPVNIIVNAVNDLPVSNPDFYAISQDVPYTTPLVFSVLANDYDVEGPLTAQLVTPPLYGSLLLNPDGTFTYDPPTTFQGTVTFQYVATDSDGAQTAPTLVTISVGPENDPPNANNDVFALNEDSAGFVGNVITNDTDPDNDVLTASLVQSPLKGSLVFNTNGSFVYTPNANFTGADTFTYQAYDSYWMSNLATVTLTINSFNDAPVPSNDMYAIMEDTTLNVGVPGVLSNDTDSDGDPLTAIFVSGPANGTLTLNGDGSFTYVPNANFNGGDSFSYRVTDGTTESINVNVGIIVNSVDDLPVAVDDTIAMTEGDPNSGNITAFLLSNDTDSDNPTPFVRAVTQPTSGTGTVAFNFMAQTVVYTPPNVDFNGVVTFTYQIGTAFPPTAGNFATVTINIAPVNDAPVANGDSYGTAEDIPITVLSPGVLLNDTDSDGDSLTASIATNPANGTVTLNNDGSFTYAPNVNFNGSDSFTYNITDGALSSGPATAVINVAPIGDTPVASHDNYVTDEDTTLTVNAASGLLSNDLDPDGGILTPHVVSSPAHGTLTVDGVGAVTYVPNPNYNGPDTFTYYVSNATGNSLAATVTLSVTAVQDAPVANPDSYGTDEDVTLNISAPGVLADDFDVDGDPIVAAQGSVAPANGTLNSFNADGSFSYTPAANFVGTDEFTYTVTDGINITAETTVTIVIGSVNDAPIAVDDVYSTGTEDSTLIIQVPGVLSNDSDPDGDAITAVLIQNPTHGSVNLLPNGRFVYTPFANYNGPDSFTYQANDGSLDSNLATVSINIQPENDGPQARNDLYITAEDTPLSIAAPGVLANDTDDDGDTLNVTLVSNPSHGVVALNPDGSFVYTPAANYNSDINGDDSFVYRAFDGNGGANNAVVTITIAPVFDPAVAVDDNFTLVEDTSFVSGGPIPSSVLTNDTYESSFFGPGSTTVFLHDDVDHGVLTMDYSTGFFDYTPNPDFSGVDTFTYTIVQFDFNTFTLHTSNIATVTFNVQPVNDAPVPADDSYGTAEDVPLVVAAPGVLANDTDVDGDTLTAVLGTNPSNGTLALNGNGSFTYTPNANFNGGDSFTYTVSDGTLTSGPVNVFINVSPVADAPVANNDSYVTDEDTTLTVASLNGLLLNDTNTDGGTLSAYLISGPANGTLVLNPDGSFSYIGNPNYNGVDSFTYFVGNGTSISGSATVTINVTAVQDAPVANPDSYGTDEDVTLNISAPGVLADDFDVDGDLIVAAQGSLAPANGTLNSFNADGSFSYTPAANFVGTDEFTYTVTDGINITDETTVTIVIGSVNDAPIAVDDVYSTGTEDSTLIIQVPGVLSNDSDPDGDAITAVLIQNPTHGSVNLLPNGRFVYTPFANYNGPDSFTYQANDGSLDSNLATVYINTQPENDGPIARNDLYITAEDTPLVVAAPGVLVNDEDADGDTLQVSLVNPPSHGIVTLNTDGSFVYTPNANYNSDINGDDQFTYKANDGNGGHNNAVVTIIIEPVFDPAIAVDDNFTILEDHPFVSGGPVPSSVLSNDTYESSFFGPGSTTVFLHDDVDHGVLNMDYSTGFFDYTPNPDFNGVDTFTYTIVQFDFNTFTLHISNIATVTFNVLPVNDAPVANPDFFSTPEDVTLNVAAPGILGNDTDVDGDSLIAILQDNPSHGILALNGNGSFSYTPNADYYGPDEFTYYANDGTSASQVTTVSINVTPVNDLPIANDDIYSMDEDTTLTVIQPGVLQNDTDIDDTVLTASLFTQPLYGTVIVDLDGGFTYVPDLNYFGTDSFTYRAHDGKGFSAPATVTITIKGVNDAPIGNPDFYGTLEDMPLAIGPRGVLNNDVDVDDDILTASLYQVPQHGIVILNGDGSFLYTPNHSYSGVDTFLYTATDGLLSTDPTTVTITIGDVNDPPIAVDDDYAVFEDTLTSFPLPGVLANDYDEEDDALTATLVAPASHGLVHLYEDGSFDYTPNPNFIGVDTFTYQANDGVSDSNVATVSITVLELNDQPIANEDYYSTDEEQPLTVASPGVLGNDFDADGDTLVALLRDNPLHGVVDLNGDGSFTYTPDDTFFGTDVFTYNANDGTSNSEYTTVTIFVRAQNDAPVAVDDTYIADEDTSLTVAAPGVLTNDTDQDNDVLSATLVLQPLHGTVFLNEDGSFEYLAYPNFYGTDSFTYKATDGLENSAPATVNITVRNAPDAPVANPDSYATQENTPITVNAPGVLADDYDLDGDPLTAILYANPLTGTVALDSDGGFTYTPQAGFNGTDYFLYAANDGTSNSAVTTVTIFVGATNDAPVANDDVFNVFEDQTTTITAPGVLSNDTDPDDLVLTATLITGPLYGTLVFNQDGSFSYTPFANYNGPDSFTYQANDGMLDSNVATVTLNVVPVDDPPLANEDFYSTNEELPLVVAAPGVLGNDSDSDGSTLSAILQDNPLHGTVALNGDGSFTYTPDNGYFGIDRFTYRANDGFSNSDKTTATINVLPLNDAPVANADTFIVAEDTTLTVTAPGVLQNDVDDDGDTMTVTLVVPTLHGAVTLNSDGSFEYTPNPNYVGADQFIYRASDGTLTSNDAIVNITVTPVQDVPVANPDMYSTQEESPINIPAPGVLANDVDLDGDALTAIPVDYPTNGALALLGDGSFTYTPNANFNGVDEFTYMATDSFDVSNITTVTINVGPTNDVPVANNDLYNVFEDMATTVSAPGVLANDTDSDVPTTLTAILINGPINGTVVLNADGSFVYTPLPNFNGIDSFTYQATDGLDNSNVATVTLNVVPVDDPPLANEDFYVVDEDQSITVAAPGVLGNDSDSDGSVLIALLQQEPPHGVIELNGDGSFTYTPDPGYFGPDYFVYQANDGVSNSTPTTASITVRPRNDRPTANADTYVVAEDSVLNQAAPGVLANDTDDDDDALTATLEVPPLHGALSLNSDGSFTYTPNPNYNGTDTFTYRAGDGIEVSNPATVTIIVTPVQDVPVANDDNYSTPEDTQLVVAAPGVLGDDVDLDNDPLTAQLVDGAMHGTISLNADGSFVYTPNPGYFGSDTFTYKAFDGTTVSNTATVTVNVGPVNDVPVANPDVYSLFEDTVSNIAAPGVLQNDTDGDNDPLTAQLITGTLNGTIVLNPNGSFTYTPFPNFNGIDTFTYQVTDGISDSNVTTVTLNVVPQQDQPLANPDFYSTTEDLPLVVATPGVLGNDFDADSEMLSAILQDNPLNGTVALNANGSFVYTPNDGFSGTDYFTYRANDGMENSNKTTATINVLPRNDAPVSTDDVYTAVEDTVLNVPAANGVLANDTDADGDVLSAVLINQPLHGTVALNGDGSFAYTPNLNFNGQDYFIYRAYDGQELSAPATVIINVTPVQDVPVAVNDNYSIPEDKVLNVVIPGVLGNDFDVDNEPLTAHLVDAPQFGIITLNPNGSFTYTPDEDFFGIDNFTYYANDGIANSNLATVVINVGGRNDGPVAVDDNYVTMEDVPLTPPAPGVLGNDVDDDGDTLTAVLITPPNHGTLVLNADGSFVYTPFLQYSGPDSFVYRANDGTTLSNPATVNITVIGVNDAPVLSNVTITSPVNENSFATLNADLYDADPADNHLVTVAWGDGSAPTIVNIPAGQTKIFLTHQYLDDNPTATPFDDNAVVLTVQDNNGGNDTENLIVRVVNLAPTFENVTLTQVVPTGGTARLQGTVKDVGTQDTFVLTVNWGDGIIENYNMGPGTSPFDYLHTYAVPGPYTVTVTVQDDDGGIAITTPSLQVRNTADLILTKTANPDPSSVGELLTYTMILTNNGPDTAHNVVLMDILPSNVEVTSSTPSYVPADGVLNFFLGDLPSGQTYRIDLVVKTLQQGPITNVATVMSDDLDPNQENNTASVTTTIGWLPNGPDLMADAVTVNTFCKTTNKGPKCAIKLWALIANRGTERANACIYSVYLSDDNVWSPTTDMKLKTKRLSALNPGQVKAQRQTIKTPTGFTSTGKFLIVVLDEGNLVFEGNETNNLIIYGPLP